MRPLEHIVLTASILSVSLNAQAQPQTGTVATSTMQTDTTQTSLGQTSAVQAWLIELLDRDSARARTIYEALGKDETRSVEDLRISRSRLEEIRQSATARGDLSRKLLELPWVEAQRQGRRGPEVNLASELQRAIEMPEGSERDERLSNLRQAMSDPALESPIRPRPYMENTLRELREQQSTTVARLEAEIARTRANNEPERRRQLWRELERMRRPALPRERWGQINRRPLAVIVQRHLQGRGETAESMTRSLTRRWGRGQAGLSPAAIPADADHRKLLTEARRRLEEFIREEDLSSFESEVLQSLSLRLEELHESGLDSTGTSLLAKLPYYGNRFLR